MKKLIVVFELCCEIEVPDDFTDEQIKTLDCGAINGVNYFDTKTNTQEYIEFEEGLEPIRWTRLVSVVDEDGTRKTE